MDELVHDLVSALEQAAEPSELGELWEKMVLSPLQHRRQIRRRRGRKRFHESSLYPLLARQCWIDASESSLDEAKEYRAIPPSTFPASVTNYSDSDDVTAANHWPSFADGAGRTRQPSWLESDSFTENNLGRPLRRRKKVKRMTPGVSYRLRQKLKVSELDHKQRHRPSTMQHLSGSTRSSSSCMRSETQSDGGRLIGKKCWKRKITKEHRDAADENMSEGETSSTCSSDPGLFTNDEGRQGDDEQSDWFFEGDCGVGAGVAGLLPSWDSDSQLSIEDRRASPKFLQPARVSDRGRQSRVGPGSSNCCIRRDRRRRPRKDSNTPVFVKRLRHLSQDSMQRDYWWPSVGHRGPSQFNPFCPMPVCPIDMMSEQSHLRCPPSVFTNRQTNPSPGLLRCTDTRRRRREAASVRITSAHNSIHTDHQRREAKGGASNASTLEAERGSAPRSPTSSHTDSSPPLPGVHEDTCMRLDGRM